MGQENQGKTAFARRPADHPAKVKRQFQRLLLREPGSTHLEAKEDGNELGKRPAYVIVGQPGVTQCVQTRRPEFQGKTATRERPENPRNVQARSCVRTAELHPCTRRRGVCQQEQGFLQLRATSGPIPEQQRLRNSQVAREREQPCRTG